MIEKAGQDQVKQVEAVLQQAAAMDQAAALLKVQELQNQAQAAQNAVTLPTADVT